jgi:prephenate dehydratase
MGRGSRWEYVFWVDLDADADEPACAAALAELRGEAEMVRLFGTYPRAIESGSEASSGYDASP